MLRTKPATAALACSVLMLVLALPVAAALGTPSARLTLPALTPTSICACQSAEGVSASSSSELRGHGPPSQNNQAAYDEQLGITFTQSFTSLEYNVTALEQTDPTLDTGPAYLLNGLSGNGLWYQVGLSWNWGPGETPGTGFDMNYEVFNSVGTSVDPPANQGGGISSFSGPVNQGDTVALNLYFNSGDVVMVAEDLNTGSYAQQTFAAEGGSYFVGLPGSVANANGFFTGLMTEWYHGDPYYSNLEGVVYSTSVSISSGWMWMDEFNPSNNDVIFASNASAPTSFTSEPSTLQEFSYNSTTEYANATEFISGALNSTSPGGTGGTGGTTSTSTPQVTMTFSYYVQGGGSGYGAPVLTYTSDGTVQTSSLTTTPTAYKLDNGSQWSVSSALPGSTSSERWVTNDTTLGSATSGAAVSVQYQTQYYVAITLNDPDGGSVQPSAGWQNAGTTLQLVATSSQGWKFEGWSTNDQAPAANGSSSLSLEVTAPVSEEATFYPGLVITASSSVSVSFSFVAPASGQTGQGMVQPGTTQSIYLPPASAIVLAANPTSFLYSGGWSIDGSASSGKTVAIEVLQPASIVAESSYNFLNLEIIVGALVLIAVAIALVLATRKRASAVDVQHSTPTPDAPAPPASA
jgi:hypothetical protein